MNVMTFSICKEETDVFIHIEKIYDRFSVKIGPPNKVVIIINIYYILRALLRNLVLI